MESLHIPVSFPSFGMIMESLDIPVSFPSFGVIMATGYPGVPSWSCPCRNGAALARGSGPAGNRSRSVINN